jgi:hypothetical protein
VASERREPAQLQAKPSPSATLEIGAVDSPLEREADRIADTVLSGTGGATAGPGAPPVESRGRAPHGSIQRTCAACEEDPLQGVLQRKPVAGSASARAGAVAAPASAAASVRQALASPGRPLAGELRAFLESRLQMDLSPVRVHTGAEADASARVLGARAYTLGPDLVFRRGAYAPATTEGRRLLAHELVHVAQQTGARLARSSAGSLIQRAPELSEADANHCTPLYLQKLCVYDRGGCLSSRDAGIPNPDELATYNSECREESGYEGDDVTLNDRECSELGSPV